MELNSTSYLTILKVEISTSIHNNVPFAEDHELQLCKGLVDSSFDYTFVGSLQQQQFKNDIQVDS
jgi:hypothetical protein